MRENILKAVLVPIKTLAFNFVASATSPSIGEVPKARPSAQRGQREEVSKTKELLG